MPAGDGDLLLWPLPVPGLTLDGTLSVSMVDTVGSTLVLTGRFLRSIKGRVKRKTSPATGESRDFRLTLQPMSCWEALAVFSFCRFIFLS